MKRLKRWVIVALVVVPPAVALFALGRQTANTDLSPEPADEILAYEITPTRGVTVQLPGALDEVLVTTWLVVAPRPVYDPATHHIYAYTITFSDRDGREIATKRYEPDARVVLPSSPSEGFSARIAGSDAWVTESRTASVEVPERMRGGGTAKIAWGAADAAAILVRTAHGEPRSATEQLVVEQAISHEQRTKLGERRTALGFFDLAPASRRRALAKWGRRLDASGKEGVDFAARRLLIGTLAAAARIAQGVEPGLLVSARHAAALNFNRPVQLEISPPWSGTVTVVDADGVRLGAVTSEDTAPVRVTDPRTTARTLIVEGTADHDVRVHAYVPPADRSAQLGDVRSFDQGTRIEIGADVRSLSAVRLDREKPVFVRVAVGQRHLKIAVRAEVAAAGGDDQATGQVEARWKDPVSGLRHATPLKPLLRRSKFDRWRSGADATDPVGAILRLPSKVEQVELVGDPNLLISLFVEDQLVTEDVLLAPYDVPLAPHEYWRNAPYDVRSWVPVHPINSDELLRDQRIEQLMAQVRILRAGGAGAGGLERPEQVLSPEGEPIARHFLEPFELGPGEPFARDARTLLSGLRPTRTVVVPSDGPDRGRLEVSFVAAETRLGDEVRLFADGARVATRTLSVRSGSMEVRLPPGPHAIDVVGLGDEGVAFASCPPSVSGAVVVRRRIVHQITRDSELVYRFEQPTDKPLTVAVDVITETRAQKWALHYRLDNPGGERVGALFHSITVPSGALFGSTADGGAGLLWEGVEATPPPGTWTHGQSKAKIHIGEDRAGTTRKLTLRLTRPEDRAWVRVVVVGTAEGAKTDTRLWVAEDEEKP